MEKMKKKVEIEETMTGSQVADFFRKIADGLQSGKIEISNGTETITLTPPAMIPVEIEAKQKKDKTEFSLELSWRCQTQPEAAKEA